MILIKKDEHELRVSKETYENMFKELGYKIVNEKKSKKTEEKINKQETSPKKVEEESKIDKFLDDVCDNKQETSPKKDKEESKIDDILNVMSNNKNKQK